MRYGLLAIAALGVSGSLVEPTPTTPTTTTTVPCGIDYPRRGMARIKDPTCKTATGPNLTMGCLGTDNPECAWCVYDRNLCEQKFPSKDDMCQQFIWGINNRQPELKGCPGFDSGLPFVPWDNYCLKQGNPVSNLLDGYMTVDQATKRCGMSRDDDGNSNCVGLWYYKETSKSTHSSAESLSKLEDPVPSLLAQHCSMSDGTSKNSVVTSAFDPHCHHDFGSTCDDCSSYRDDEHHEVVVGCKQGDTWHETSFTDPKPDSNETYVWFKSKWEPTNIKSECELPPKHHQLLGASLGSDFDSPVSLFDPLYINVQKTIFTGEPYRTNTTSVLDAWHQCANDHSSGQGCLGFTYGPPCTDIPEIPGVEVKFYNGAPGTPLPSVDLTSYQARWCGPTSPPWCTSPTAAEVVVV